MGPEPAIRLHKLRACVTNLATQPSSALASCAASQGSESCRSRWTVLDHSSAKASESNGFVRSTTDPARTTAYCWRSVASTGSSVFSAANQEMEEPPQNKSTIRLDCRASSRINCPRPFANRAFFEPMYFTNRGPKALPFRTPRGALTPLPGLTVSP